MAYIFFTTLTGAD